MKTEPNYPAYPISEEATDRIDKGVKIYYGLTKLEEFSSRNMQALIANNFSPMGFQNGDENGLAELAVKSARALIKALNKENP